MLPLVCCCFIELKTSATSTNYSWAAKIKKQSYQSSRSEASDKRHHCWRAHPSTGIVGSIIALMAAKLCKGKMGLLMRIPLTPGSPSALKRNQATRAAAHHCFSLLAASKAASCLFNHETHCPHISLFLAKQTLHAIIKTAHSNERFYVVQLPSVERNTTNSAPLAPFFCWWNRSI